MIFGQARFTFLGIRGIGFRVNRKAEFPLFHSFGRCRRLSTRTWPGWIGFGPPPKPGTSLFDSKRKPASALEQSVPVGFCLSLKQPAVPTPLEVRADSKVEVTW